MAKDYFQDIVPSQDPHRRQNHVRRISVSEKEGDAVDEIDDADVVRTDRSIRNVNIAAGRPRRHVSEIRHSGRVQARGKRPWLWAIAGVSILVLAVLLLMLFRPTTITVTPRTHKVVFDQTNQYVAYPVESAVSGLSYTTQTVDLEDSDAISSAGVVHAEDKASGQVVVYNNFSPAPVKLLKNTRFSTTGGLIFRAPADIVIPGKTASAPGKVTVTVIADQAGDTYNIAAASRLALPGLKSTPDMYAKVYAVSTDAISGGFIGDKPGVSEADSERTVAAIRARLEAKARDAASALQNATNVVFLDLVQIRYEDEPATPEAGGKVRLHEKAHVAIPVFVADDFADAIASSVSSTADKSSVYILPGDGYGATAISATSTLGSEPLQFGLVGTATIVWKVDSAALAKALAGRDQGAFQTVVTTFAGIQEAHARIEPFWSSSFPKDAGVIRVKVLNPAK